MRIVFTSANPNDCARLLGLDELPDFGESTISDGVALISNATPCGRYLLQSFDVILLVSLVQNVDWEAVSSVTADYANGITQGVLAAWLYERLRPFVKEHPKDLIVNGKVVEDETALKGILEDEGFNDD